MYLCYLDESGTADIPGNTSQYVLAGLAIPVWNWRSCDESLVPILSKYGLQNEELHTAWILRAYPEQNKIPDFANLTYVERRQNVEQLRRSEVLRLQRAKNPKLHKQTRKNYAKTNAYIHLSFLERKQLMLDVANCIASWGSARLFAECVDKITFTGTVKSPTPDVEALEQIVSRFEHFLTAMSNGGQSKQLGMLIHDNNHTVATKHTHLMRKFLDEGTLWVDIDHIIETPLFVDSALTRMVQVADLCAYAIRRHLENQEDWLFDVIFSRADKKSNGTVVGVRHFTPKGCRCKICAARNR